MATKKEFKVGDKVKIIEEYAPSFTEEKILDRSGKYGVITKVETYPTSYPYYVKVDGYPNPIMVHKVAPAEESKVKVGDRVKIIHEYTPEYEAHFGHCLWRDLRGATGTVYQLRGLEEVYPYRIQLDGSGEIVWCNEVEPIKQKFPVIVISTDGVVTKATKRLGKETLGTAYSKCAPGDIFDSDFGALLALSRLCDIPVTFEEEEPPKPKEQRWPMKLICISTCDPWWTVGKIYDVIEDNGAHFIKDDDANNPLPHYLRRLDGEYWVLSIAERYPRFVPLIEE